MAFCIECGANVPDGISFCTECGKPMRDAQPSVPALSPVYTQPPAPITPPAQPEPQPPVGIPPRLVDTPKETQKSGSPVLGVGAYIGFIILFAIPVIGWIVCIIMSFTAKNLNARNFARATLVFIIIGIVLTVIFYFLFRWISEAAMQYINEVSNGAFGNLDEIEGLFDFFKQAGSL